MHISTIILGLLGVTTSLAAQPNNPITTPPSAPTPPLSVKTNNNNNKNIPTFDRPGNWTIHSYKRYCTKDDKACKISFKINTNLKTPQIKTKCKFDYFSSEAGASHASYDNMHCNGAAGNFRVGSTWNNQFGPDKGFTTLSVLDPEKKLIIWPSYSDSEVVNGVAVSPDKSYEPLLIPWVDEDRPASVRWPGVAKS